jgi:uncharacterized phage protein gp47/JayE
VRDSVNASLPGADATVPNSVLRVVSDATGATCHLTLQYIDWLALQLLPDTAETEWLDRHATIWLVDASGQVGRKLPTLASGTVTMTGVAFTTVPIATQMTFGNVVAYETTAPVVLAANAPEPVAVRAITPGSIGNIDPGSTLSVVNAPIGVDNVATVVEIDGGTDIETDDELRARVLKRIRQPPQGGDKSDYEQWALAVPGCTRAWCSPLEMGMGTVTVRVMFDDLRASNNGFPIQNDLDSVAAYIDTVRPVAVKDFWVLAPLPQRVDLHIFQLNPNTQAVRAAIEQSLLTMLFLQQAPGQTIYSAWINYAIMNAPGVISFDLLDTPDAIMESPGHIAVLGNIFYDQPASDAAVPTRPAPFVLGQSVLGGPDVLG